MARLRASGGPRGGLGGYIPVSEGENHLYIDFWHLQFPETTF